MIAARLIGLGTLLGCLSGAVAAAQGPVQSVNWSLSKSPGAAAKPGSHLTLDLTANIDEGWHVYGLGSVQEA